MSSLLLIAGPCVLEEERGAVEIAKTLRDIAARQGVSFMFKASFDKANRTSLGAYRGPGLDKGLRMLAAIRGAAGVRVMSDIHEPAQAAPAAEVLDMLQIPAFLCRQTDLVVAAARTMKPLNLKKGQFVSPLDMGYVANKAAETGNRDLWLTERGACFGYNNLVVDFRSLSIMRGLGYPVIFDATHSVQIPSQGGASSGRREFVAPLARAAAAYGIDGLFLEVHPEPDKALCDGPNSLPLAEVETLLATINAIRAAAGA